MPQEQTERNNLPRWLRITIELLLLFAALLGFLAGGGMFVVRGDNIAIPPLEGITQYGCVSYTLLTGSVRATAWADYDDEHLESVRKRRFPLEFEKEHPHRGWVHLLSERIGKNADLQSAKDCVEWKREVTKVLKQNQKKEGKQ